MLVLNLVTGLVLATTTVSAFAQLAPPSQTVPEPDSWTLVGLGVVVAWIVRRITKR